MLSRWFRALASLKLTVVLVLLLAVVLSAGTILESLQGAEAARSVYYAPWFFALQGLFAINVACALVDRWPRNRWRIGFAITHLSMLLILAGALMTALYKVEGRMPLWEGQDSNLVFRSADGDVPPYELPFRIRLKDFQMDLYPGTMRPAMFRSLVAVVDPAAGAESAAVIEMNKPLSHGGYQFFQSSYQQSDGREMSILAVSHDPGQPVVFLGYTLLVLGMIVVFVTRLVQQRAADRAGMPGPAATALGVALLAVLAGAAAAGAAVVPDARDLEALRAVPVQHDGRVMPFDTQARNAVWTVTGRAGWPGVDPVAMAFGWALDPQGWANEPIVRVRGDVAALAGLPAGSRWASFLKLAGNQELLRAMSEAGAHQEAEQKLSATEKHLLELQERLVTLDGYFRGREIRTLPASDRQAAWQPVTPLQGAAHLVEVAGRIRAAAPDGYPSRAAIERELGYNAARPTRLAWLFLLPAALAAAATLERDRFGLTWVARVGVVGGFAVATWGIAERWLVAGRIPASNMYESMLFLGWGVALFGVVSVLLRNRMLVFNAAAMAALAALLSDLLPMDPFIHPMAPVLSGTPWLAIHVPIIMLSYATLTIVTFFAHLVVGVEIFAPGRRDLAARWSQLAYWYTHVGAILLITGILTGSIWAASSWGRYWGWDPKEVWSLVAFLAYMAILHARSDRQIGGFGVAVASIAAFWTILMTYLGVNFVLASGLHSYGFGSSSLVNILVTVAAVETAFLAAGWFAVRRRRVAAPAK
jgi:cytochrome c-type biogenesis protein CcsB